MLQRIRERISGWIAGVVIAIIGGAFVLFGVQYYFQQGAGDRNLAATVNGQKISHQEVNTAYTQMVRQTMLSQGGKPLNDMMKRQLKSMALQSIVTNIALTTGLEAEGFHIGMPQVKMIVAQAPEFQVDGQFSKTRFLQILAQAGLSPAAFFQRVQSQFITSQATTGIAVSAFALPNEVLHAYQLSAQKRAFGYLMVPATYFDDKTSVTEKEVKQYYQNNMDQFKTPEQVSVSYLLLSPKTIGDQVQVSQDQAREYYETNLINYQVPEHWKIEQVLIPVKSAASAAEVAAAKKQASKQLGLWRKGTVPKDMRETTLSAAQLTDKLLVTLQSLKPGLISEPLRTPQGFSLLKVVSYTPKKTRDFHSVEKNIIAMLKRQQVNQMFSKQSSQLADLTYTNPSSLAPAAKALGLTVKVSPLIGRSGEKKGVFSNQKVLSTVFGADVFSDGNNSNPVTLADGSQVVVRINKKVPSKQLSLSDVERKIKTQLLAQKAKSKSGVLAYQLQKDLLAGNSPEALAKKHQLHWHEVGLMTVGDKQLKKLPAPITQSVFSTRVSSLAQSGKPLGVSTVLLKDGAYAVVAITNVSSPSSATMPAKEQAELSSEFSMLWGRMMQHYFVKSIVSDAKVVMHKQA